MHSYILKDADEKQLREIIDKSFRKVKMYNEELYDDLELTAYKVVYGCHFTEWLLEKSLKALVNEDGTYGGHWTLEQTTEVAKQQGIEFKNFNEYDWCYVMNMVYSDYYGVLPNELIYYVNLSKKFLEDKDSKKGKALCYWLAIKS